MYLLPEWELSSSLSLSDKGLGLPIGSIYLLFAPPGQRGHWITTQCAALPLTRTKDLPVPKLQSVADDDLCQQQSIGTFTDERRSHSAVVNAVQLTVDGCVAPNIQMGLEPVTDLPRRRSTYAVWCCATHRPDHARLLVHSIPSERVGDAPYALVRPPFDPVRLFPNRIDPRASDKRYAPGRTRCTDRGRRSACGPVAGFDTI